MTPRRRGGRRRGRNVYQHGADTQYRVPDEAYGKLLAGVASPGLRPETALGRQLDDPVSMVVPATTPLSAVAAVTRLRVTNLVNGFAPFPHPGQEQ